MEPVERPDVPEFKIRKRADIYAEMRTHSGMHGEWVRYAAYLEYKLERDEEKMEFMCAPLRKAFREDLIRQLGKSNVTSQAINDELLCVERVQKLTTRIRETRGELKAAKAIVVGLQEKTKLIQSYGGLLRRELDKLGDE